MKSCHSCESRNPETRGEIVSCFLPYLFIRIFDYIAFFFGRYNTCEDIQPGAFFFINRFCTIANLFNDCLNSKVLAM